MERTKTSKVMSGQQGKLGKMTERCRFFLNSL